jgi:signal transduction histidine kinase
MWWQAFLCHELRNPLHIITSNAEFLIETKINNEQAEFVRAIDNMSKLMTSIVNDVLGNYIIDYPVWTR